MGSVARSLPVDASIPLNLRLLTIDERPDDSATISLRVVPPAELSYTQNGSEVTGSLTCSAPGTYTLIAEMTGVDGNAERRFARFLVTGSGGSWR